jgi:hypothetical protein
LDILLKYCGGCNCQIDRSKVVDELKKKMSPEDRLVLEAPQTPAEAGLLLCGCPSACNDKPELTRQASRWITVAGKSVNHRDMPEDDLAEAILNAVDDIKK